MTTGSVPTQQDEERGQSRYLGHDLIFVISQPRSGSTLLQRMLAGHPWIQTSAETWLMLHPAYGLRRQGIQTDYRANWAVGAVEEFLDHYTAGRETYLDGLRAFAQTIYGAALAQGGKRRFLDKTPRYTMIVPELAELFPRARFVLLLRNPLAVLASELNTYIQGDWPRLANFAPDLIDAPARLVEARQLLAGNVIEVRYEDLVTRPEHELQQICAYLGLPWEPGLEDYSKTPPPRGRANDPVGVHRHQRPSRESLETWRTLGRDAQTRHFALSYLEAIGDVTLAQLGYAPDALRAGIEDEPHDRPCRPIFPWSTAVRPENSWSLREKTAAARYFAARENGPVAGLVAAVGAVARRVTGGFTRLAGRRVADDSTRHDSRPGGAGDDAG